jgi:hypothetical protein
MLAFLFVRLRRARLLGPRSARWQKTERVTLEAMNEMISDLAPTLRETAMVTAPQSYVDRGHVWASPCGKRVYIN